jgi:hypothetical protein
MAISLGFGVLYAAIMTLFLVPVGYVILDELVRGRQRSEAAGGHPGGREDEAIGTPARV